MGFTYEFGNKIQYFAVGVNLTLNPENTGIVEGTKIIEAWDGWFKTQVSKYRTRLFKPPL